MRYLIVFLAIAGIVVLSLALVEHYGPPADTANLLHSDWNSAYIDQSPYAQVLGAPVDALGILAFAALAILAWIGNVIITVYAAGIALAYALYLTDIEAQILRVWSVYWVSSLVLIVLILFLSFAQLIFGGVPATRR